MEPTHVAAASNGELKLVIDTVTRQYRLPRVDEVATPTLSTHTTYTVDDVCVLLVVGEDVAVASESIMCQVWIRDCTVDPTRASPGLLSMLDKLRSAVRDTRRWR